jgi:hypothetical protein
MNTVYNAYDSGLIISKYVPRIINWIGLSWVYLLCILNSVLYLLLLLLLRKSRAFLIPRIPCTSLILNYVGHQKNLNAAGDFCH